MTAHAADHSRTNAARRSGSPNVTEYVTEVGERWPTGFDNATFNSTATSDIAKPGTRSGTTLAGLLELYTATLASVEYHRVASAFVEGQQIGELGGHPVLVTAVLGSATSREAALGFARSTNDPRIGPAVVVRSMHRMPDGKPAVRFTALRAGMPPGTSIDADAAVSGHLAPRFGDLTVTDIVFGTTRVCPADCASLNPWLYLLE